MSFLSEIEKLPAVIVGEDAGVIVIKSVDGQKLFTTSPEYNVNWFTTTNTMKLRHESTGKHVLTLIETNKQIRNVKSVEVREESSDKIIGCAVMKKRFFWTSHEIRKSNGQRISGFHCDGEKYVFDGDIGTARHNEKSKHVSFTVKFTPSLDKETKLLMIASAFLMIRIEKEAQQDLNSAIRM